jgi:hypothetical protein
MSKVDRFLNMCTSCTIFFPLPSMGKIYTPFGIRTDTPAALAGRLGMLIFIGLMLAGMGLNLLVDIHEILAPVSNNLSSVIAGYELI